MANPYFNLADAVAILKEDYLPPIREQLNTATPLLAELERKTEEVVGKRAYVPLHTARAEAVGARAEYGSLPTASAQGYKESVFPVKYQYARIEITLPAIEATKTDKGSFLRAVDSEMKGAVTELKEDVDRQLCSNDETASGALAKTAVNTAQTVIVLAGTNAATFRRLRVGQVIDFVDSTNDAVLASGRSITAVTPATPSITISGAAITTTVNHRVVRTGNWKNEMVGLPGIVKDSGTLQGVDPASFPVWKATNNANGGTPRALSEDLMQQVVDAVGIDCGEEPDSIVAEHTQRRKFYALLQSMKRAVNTTELKGGFKALTFDDDKPILVERFVDADRMYFINKKHLAIFEMADWNWADQDGNVLSRVSGKPSFEGFLYKFAELGTDRRNAQGVLADLS